MQSGIVYRLPQQEPRTGDEGYLSLHLETFPTPAASDYKIASKPGQRRRQLPGHNGIVGGLLNPVFCERLMGFPQGWTDLGA